MTRDSFNTLVSQLEVAWSGRQEGLLRHTVRWVMLGYITLLGALLGGLLLLAAGVVLAVKFQSFGGTLIAGMVALTGALTAAFVFGALWVRFDPPPGLELSEEDHPDLHALIAETSEVAGGVRFHRVILDSEMNASVVQNPRLGVLGWYRAYLVLGLPLLESLDVEEFKAVLAHEFAHVAGADGKTGAWLHRTRTTWERVVAHMSSGPYCPFVARFFNWFWPRFNSRAFILSRFNEFAADRISAQAVSPEALARGLQRLAIQSERLEDELWDPLERKFLGSEALPEDVMERMSTLLRRSPDPRQAEMWLRRVLGKSKDGGASHPSLGDRLAQLGFKPTETALFLDQLAPAASAAEELLRPSFLAKSRAVFSRQWLAEALKSPRNSPAGRSSRQEVRSVKEAWNRIAALSRLDGLEKIQPEVLALLERRPNHSGALYLRGCHLAAKGDPNSTKFLEQAAADPTLSVRAFETLASFYAQLGRTAETATMRERAERHERELRSALVERNHVTREDSFLPHDLCAREIESLRETLEREPVVRRAWVGAKQVKHFPTWRYLIVIVDVRWPAFKPVSERAQKELIARILENWEADGYVHALRLDEGTRATLRAMKRGMADCSLYRRS
ncbi:M48 family metallopeptidase [Luteolibacter luteus]|uniref:M48 family metalloprotease n=1 Tax=Luteolibacter luteus TaxID=2728835 RepID=A0A858RIH4_9BACT|nr:M48 family metallopeptidase [Luteolibacter luteus]QJE96707.1 M48 family metalloprotease [Luteolibacter luteus]